MISLYRDDPLAREGDQRAPREKRFAEPVESPGFPWIVSVVVVVAGPTRHVLVHRLRVGSGGYTCLCEPALDLAQHCADVRPVASAAQQRVVARKRLEQALVLPEQRLRGAEAVGDRWRCAREGRV